MKQEYAVVPFWGVSLRPLQESYKSVRSSYSLTVPPLCASLCYAVKSRKNWLSCGSYLLIRKTRRLYHVYDKSGKSDVFLSRKL